MQWRINRDGHINREELTVKSVNTNAAVLKAKNGEESTISLKDPQHLDYAWAVTSYSSQSMTKDRVISLMESSSSRQSWYVTLSRAKYEVSIVTDSKDELAKRVLKNVNQENALDYLPSLPKQKWVDDLNKRVAVLKQNSAPTEQNNAKKIQYNRGLEIEI